MEALEQLMEPVWLMLPQLCPQTVPEKPSKMVWITQKLLILVHLPRLYSDKDVLPSIPNALNYLSLKISFRRHGLCEMSLTHYH